MYPVIIQLIVLAQIPHIVVLIYYTAITVIKQHDAELQWVLEFRKEKLFVDDGLNENKDSDSNNIDNESGKKDTGETSIAKPT